jgi:hypothetical protein
MNTYLYILFMYISKLDTGEKQEMYNGKCPNAQ